MVKDKDIAAILKQAKKVPEVKEEVEKEKPVPEIEGPKDDNCVSVDGKLIEIKPTLLKYFRNNAVSFYRVIDSAPLPMIYQMTEETNGIDGDTAVLTFISAVLDDAKLAKKIYTQIDSEQLYRIVSIFKKLNGISDREEKSKNVQAAKGKG